MADFVIDTSTDPELEHYEETVELDGREYLLRFDWNRRDESWYLGVYLPDGTALSTGRRILHGVSLLRGEIDSRLPPGLLMAVDFSGTQTDPGIDELGIDARCGLVYTDAEDLAAELAAVVVAQDGTDPDAFSVDLDTVDTGGGG